MRSPTRLLAPLLIAASIATGGALARPAAAAGYVPADEATVHSLVNKTRASKGLSQLIRHDQLVAMAREQADRMAAQGNIFHNTNLGGDIASRGLQWLRVGENVGMGPNVQLIQQAFLDSPAHYENIVKADYNHLGTGVVDGQDGKRYVVQVFANLKGAAAPTAPAHPAPPAPEPPAAVPPVPAAVAPVPVVPPPAPAPPTTAPTPTPPAPSADPNALVGGHVNELPLQTSHADGSGGALQTLGRTSSSVLDRVVDIFIFWA